MVSARFLLRIGKKKKKTLCQVNKTQEELFKITAFPKPVEEAVSYPGKSVKIIMTALLCGRPQRH